MNEIKIFTPATIANVSCGFDVLGMALDTIGDEMLIRKVPEKGVKITKIIGQNLPLETHKNVAGVSALALLAQIDCEFGFEIEIDKRIKPGSGIGSSAASSAGVVWAINELLGKPFNSSDLVRFAMEGERLATGVAHADNVAPALFGGFTLVRSYEPLDIISLPTPKDLYATILHPQIEIKTADAREILKTTVSLKKAIKQWGNVGGLISGLYEEDYDLIGRSLEDFIIEPIRSILIPAFDTVKQQSINSGALGGGISGSGPSIFALSKGEETALKVADGMRSVYEKIDIDYEIHVSKINKKGIRILKY
ncbi:MAG: homoserine kinase [Lutibacter sp.]|nr:MAG: homoserine kinase [Lutibacter sp.]